MIKIKDELEDGYLGEVRPVASDMFKGITLHPALDIVGDVMVISYSYLSTQQKIVKDVETQDLMIKALHIIIAGDEIKHSDSNQFEYNGKNYYIDIENRIMANIELAIGKDNLDHLNTATVGDTIVDNRLLFNSIITLIEQYVNIDNVLDKQLLAAWIIGTYYFPIFPAYPFLNLKAMKGSGKTQLMLTMRNMCFNASMGTCTESALGDAVHSQRSTMFFDQADKLSAEYQEPLCNLILESYKKGSNRIITEFKGRIRYKTYFETYSPKCFASHNDLQEDLRDRCLIIPLIKSSARNFPSPLSSLTDWKQVRLRLIMSLIKNYQKSQLIASRTNEFLTMPSGKGRELELWIPLQVILETYDCKDLIPELSEHFFSRYELSKPTLYELDISVIKAIVDYTRDDRDAQIKPSMLIDFIPKEDYYCKRESDRFTMSIREKARQIGNTMKKLNLSLQSERSLGGVCHTVNHYAIKQLIKEYNIEAGEGYTPSNIKVALPNLMD